MQTPLLLSAHQPQPACATHVLLLAQRQSPAAQPDGHECGRPRPSACPTGRHGREPWAMYAWESSEHAHIA